MNDYPSAEENRSWVRKRMEAKGFQNDSRTLVMRLPKRSIDILFGVIMRAEFPDHV